MSTSSTTAQSGFTLIELLLASVVLVSIASLSLQLYSTFNRVRNSADAAIDESRVYGEIDRVFRSRVNSSSRVLADFEGIETGDATLILQHPDDTISLFRAGDANGTLSLARWSREGDEWVCDAFRSYQIPDADFQFMLDNPRVPRLAIHRGREAHQIDVPSTVEIVAALRPGGRP